MPIAVAGSRIAARPRHAAASVDARGFAAKRVKGELRENPALRDIGIITPSLYQIVAAL